MDCFEAEDLLASHVLGALEPPEREEIEAHLATCPRCSSIYYRERGVASLLALAVPQQALSPRVKARLLSRIDALTRRQRREAAHPRVGVFRGWRLLPVYLAASLAALAFAGMLTLGIWFNSRLNHLTQENRRLADGVAKDTSLLFYMANLLNEETNQNIDMLSRQNSQLVKMIQEQRSLSYLSATPGMTVYMLEADEESSRSRGMLMVSHKGTYAILAALQLDPLPPGRVYQAWLIKDGQRESAGLFKVDSFGYGQLSITPAKPLSEYRSIGITVEPEGGSEAPTGTRVIGGDM